MTLATALRQGAELLERAGIGVPRLTAEVLLAHALHRDRTFLYAHPEQELREVEWIHYGRFLHERLKRKPTQYITRVQEFYGRPFLVTPDVLIPRPETEGLIEIALPFARASSLTIDVGTGSGAIAVTLQLETKTPTLAIDISQPAIAVATRNAADLGAHVTFVCADALSAVQNAITGLVVSNPPYVAERDRDSIQPEVRDWEPSIALFSGATGLEFYERLIPEAARVLRPGGSLVMEVGWGQTAAVKSLFGPEWEPPEAALDLAGIERVVHSRKKIRNSGTPSAHGNQ